MSYKLEINWAERVETYTFKSIKKLKEFVDIEISWLPFGANFKISKIRDV